MPRKRDTVKRRRLLRPSSGRHTGAYLYVPGVELERAGRLDATHYTVWGTERGGVLVRLYREGDPDEDVLEPDEEDVPEDTIEKLGPRGMTPSR